LKPADAAASTAVYRVVDVGDATARWPEVRSLSPSGTGIIEDYVEGPEVSVEAVVVEGNLLRASVTTKETGGPTGFLELAHTVVSDDDLLPDATAAVEQVVRAWSIGSAVLHAEFKLSPEGLELIEAAARPAGDLIPELVEVALGRDLYLSQAALALGDDPPPDRPRVASCAGIRFALASGVVRRQVAPAEVVPGLDRIRLAEQLFQPGRRLPPLIANWTRSAYVLGWSDELEPLRAELEEATERIAALMGVSIHA
jgi:hypothetical protein